MLLFEYDILVPEAVLAALEATIRPRAALFNEHLPLVGLLERLAEPAELRES